MYYIQYALRLLRDNHEPKGYHYIYIIYIKKIFFEEE